MRSVQKWLSSIFAEEDIPSLVYLEILFGLLISIWSLLIFIYVTVQVMQNQTSILDMQILSFVIDLRVSWLTPIMYFASFIGSEGTIFGALLVVILLTLRKHKKESLIFTIILILGLITTVFLKNSYEIDRPTIDPLHAESTYSYPSGHAINSLLFYSTLSLFVYHFTKSKTKAVLSFAATGFLIFLIGFSRVYLGAHYPSDVISGWISGLWLFVTVILIDKTIQYFRISKNRTVG